MTTKLERLSFDPGNQFRVDSKKITISNAATYKGLNVGFEICLLQRNADGSTQSLPMDPKGFNSEIAKRIHEFCIEVFEKVTENDPSANIQDFFLMSDGAQTRISKREETDPKLGINRAQLNLSSSFSGKSIHEVTHILGTGLFSTVTHSQNKAPFTASPSLFAMTPFKKYLIYSLFIGGISLAMYKSSTPEFRKKFLHKCVPAYKYMLDKVNYCKKFFGF